MFACREVERLRLAVERIVTGTQDGAGFGGRHLRAVHLERIRLGDVTDHLVALRGLFVDADGASRCRDGVTHRAVAREEADALQRRGNGERAFARGVEVDAAGVRRVEREVPVDVGEGSGGGR